MMTDLSFAAPSSHRAHRESSHSDRTPAIGNYHACRPSLPLCVSHKPSLSTIIFNMEYFMALRKIIVSHNEVHKKLNSRSRPLVDIPRFSCSNWDEIQSIQKQSLEERRFLRQVYD